MPYGADMKEVLAMQAAGPQTPNDSCQYVTVKPKDDLGTFDDVPNPNKLYVYFDLDKYLNANPPKTQCWVVCRITKNKPTKITPGGGTIVIGG